MANDLYTPPFNDVDDNEFSLNINNDSFLNTVDELNNCDILFNPYDLDELDSNEPLDNVDPDIIYFSEMCCPLHGNCLFSNEISLK